MKVFATLSEALLLTKVEDAIFESIQRYPYQKKLTVKEYTQLIAELSKSQNQQLLRDNKEELFSKLLIEWMPFIGELQSLNLVEDADSVESFIKKLEAKYGIMPFQIKKSLSSIPDSVQLTIHESGVEPNKRQKAIAHYMIGHLNDNSTASVCVVPAGQGKSRIAAYLILLLLSIEQDLQAYIVYPNKYLMERDQEAFRFYWDVLKDRVHFQVGLDFSPQPDDVIIADEADDFLFSDLTAFIDKIKYNPTICFTATIDNDDKQGVERKLIQAGKFQVYDTTLDLAGKIVPEISSTIDGSSVSELIQFIKTELDQRPVLLRCTSDMLYKALRALMVATLIQY